MTKHFCDSCKKELTMSDGPIFVSAVHRLGDGTYCKDCFFDKKNLSSLKTRLFKEIEKHVDLYRK